MIVCLIVAGGRRSRPAQRSYFLILLFFLCRWLDKSLHPPFVSLGLELQDPVASSRCLAGPSPRVRIHEPGPWTRCAGFLSAFPWCKAWEQSFGLEGGECSTASMCTTSWVC